MNELTGIIKAIGQTQQISATFEKRELVIEVTEGEYSNVGVFEAVQDKCGVLDGFKVGQLVTVAFFWSGRTDPWVDPKTGNERYFNSLKVASINAVGSQQQAPPAPAFEPPAMDQGNVGGSQEVPF